MSDTRLERAWLLRDNQRIEECRAAVAGIRSGLAAGDPLLPEVELLVASLERADGRYAESKARIAAAEASMTPEQISRSFALAFQKGVTVHALDGDARAGLDHFLVARSRAVTPRQTIISLFSSMVCLEALGLSYAATAAELRALLESCPDREAFKGISAQLCAMRMREGFHRGAIDLSGPTEGEQARFLRVYFSELPYHAASGAVSPEEIEALFLGDPTFYRRPYRLRTLQGVQHPVDDADPDLGEFSDRLYLWTWRWLAGRHEQTIEQLLELLATVDLRARAHDLEAEDFQLIQCSLLWLSVFDPTRARTIDGLLREIRPRNLKEAPLFEFERQLALYFRYRRQGARAEAAAIDRFLRANPLARRSGGNSLQMATLMGGEAPERLERLRYALRAAEELTETDSWLVVDVASHRIELYGARPGKRPKQTVLSEPMAFALERLSAEPSISCEEFAELCFGVRRYDTLIHQPKIFNLLARIRALLPPGLQIGVRSGRVFALGEWKQVSFRDRTGESGAVGLAHHRRWKAAVAGLATRDSAEVDPRPPRLADDVWVLSKLGGKNEIRRPELEKLLGKSRATANRMIQGWVSTGLLTRIGAARSTTYKINSSSGGSK